MSHANHPPKCPHCGFTIFDPDLRRCEECGGLLPTPAPLPGSEADGVTGLNKLQQERARIQAHVAQMRREMKASQAKTSNSPVLPEVDQQPDATSSRKGKKLIAVTLILAGLAGLSFYPVKSYLWIPLIILGGNLASNKSAGGSVSSTIIILGWMFVVLPFLSIVILVISCDGFH